MYSRPTGGLPDFGDFQPGRAVHEDTDCEGRCNALYLLMGMRFILVYYALFKEM